MKAITLSVLILASALSSPPIAHAFDVTGVMIAITLQPSIEVTAVVVAPSATTSGASDVAYKQAYFAELRDDAVEEIADDDTPSAVLADAIQQIRDQTGTTASDRDLALAIVKAMN